MAVVDNTIPRGMTIVQYGVGRREIDDGFRWVKRRCGQKRYKHQMCERTEREKREWASVRKGSGTRTIYLYTIDWPMCTHYEG